MTFNVETARCRPSSREARAAHRRTGVALPAGVYLEFTGAAAAEARRPATNCCCIRRLALALIVMILFVAFRWRANGWLVLANLPFSLIGSVLAIALTDVGLSLGTLVGLVTVFGISARNAILQLAHYEHLVEVEGAQWDIEPSLRGANERLVPILMTARRDRARPGPLAFGMRPRRAQEIEGPDGDHRARAAC